MHEILCKCLSSSTAMDLRRLDTNQPKRTCIILYRNILLHEYRMSCEGDKNNLKINNLLFM